MQTKEELVQEAAMLQYNIKNEFNFLINKNTKLQLIQDATNRLGQIFSQLNDDYNSPKIKVGDTVSYKGYNHFVKDVDYKDNEVILSGIIPWVKLTDCTLISKQNKITIMKSVVNRENNVIKEGDLVENIDDKNFIILVDEVAVETFSGTVVSKGSNNYDKFGHFSKYWTINRFIPFTGTSVTLFND